MIPPLKPRSGEEDLDNEKVVQEVKVTDKLSLYAASMLFCRTFIVLYAFIQVDAILNFYESVANIVNFDAFLCLKLAQSKETGP